MAQPVVQQPTLSPPVSPTGAKLSSLVHSPITELNGKVIFRADSATNGHQSHQLKKSHSNTSSTSASSLQRHKPRARPSSSKANDTNGHDASSNGDHTHKHGVEAANDPTIAQAPGASFSIATKPQDRDPSLLRQPPQSQSKGFDSLSSYQLDHNGRIPASEFNYLQRDKLVSSAQQSAIRSGNLHWVALMDLAHLASQHHMSPYSNMKFGPRGSPFAYIPITLQQPEIVENTMIRQREEELEAKAWLIAKRQARLGHATSAQEPMDSDVDLPVLSLPQEIFKQVNGQPSINGAPSSIGTKRPASLTTPPDTRASRVLRTDPDVSERKQVERDLSEAMADSIDASRSPPQEVMAPPSQEVSSSEEDGSLSPAKHNHVDLSSFDRSTRMVEIGSARDHKDEDSSAPIKDSNKEKPEENGVADELMTSSQAGSNVEVGGPMDKERIMAQEMEKASPSDKRGQLGGGAGSGAAKDTSLGPLNHTEGTSHGPTGSGNDAHTLSSEQQRRQQQNQLAMKTSDTHPIHISPILPDDLLADVGRRIHSRAEQKLLQLDSSDGAVDALPADSQLTVLNERYFDDHAREQIEGKRLIRLRNMLDLTTITATDPSANYLSQSQLAEQASKENTLTLSSSQDAEGKDGMGTGLDGPSIGNLLLSSCPGKKVRLSGPVRGRGAICRDLGLDLDRIFSIGVRAVVCCLNDEELSYLGAPWSEYEREADRLGLEVYRLPMAEGFAPTNVQEMDAAMTSIVSDCTMKGTNVLVHCRGGVGRAGLIACSWLLKMGFVGERSKKGLREADAQARVGDATGSSKKIVEQTTSVGSHDAIMGSDSHTNGKDMHLSGSAEQGQEDEAECDTILDTVRCLIETIRRRRSPKAIETAEQVRFLVEYVTYLHRQERLKASHGNS